MTRFWGGGALVAAVIGVAVIVPGQAAQAAYSDPLTSVATGNLGLVWHATSDAAIAALVSALPNVGVATVLASANHSMESCGSTEQANAPIAPAATTLLCWESGDAATTAWNPQGI